MSPSSSQPTSSNPSTRILVTGGAGFIGSHIVDKLVAHNYSVAVVDNLSTGDRDFVNPAARFYKTSILDEGGLRRIFEAERPDFVYHQAARVSVRESMQNPVLYAETNVVGSLVVLDMCREYGVKKIIYASTGGAVYGEPQYLPVDEEHPVNPLDPYGASKHHVEHYLYLYRANYGLEYTVLRYANVYGPRQDPAGEAGVVAIFSERMLTGEPVTINGTGEQERDFVFVEDVAEANWRALSGGDGRIYNVGTGIGSSVNSVFATLRGITAYRREPVCGPAKAGEVLKIRLDVDKAHRELGWQPTVTMAQGLGRTVEWFRREFAERQLA
ncbi:MAG: NAD-dependent epimerase/dehydratase family protein [Chloroflexi bacterium]|nr:NAD-dependent epimerase/dehydratase family protein [Chloroflexota bacterium]